MSTYYPVVVILVGVPLLAAKIYYNYNFMTSQPLLLTINTGHKESNLSVTFRTTCICMSCLGPPKYFYNMHGIRT